jgi:hypothetical protein
MKWRCVILSGIFLSAAGCASHERHSSVEQRLVSAGFVQHPFNEDTHGSLPPQRIIIQKKSEQTLYLYANPTQCQCVYIGDYHAYARFEYLTSIQHQIDAQTAREALNGNPTKMEYLSATPSSYWYPTYYQYYYPSVSSGLGYYNPSWFSSKF